MPGGPGVYLMLNAAGQVIYVGKAVNLRNRVRSYFREDGGHSPRTRYMVPSIASIDWISTESEVEALVLESVLIKRHQPRNNVLLKDNKGYPFLKLTNEEFPRLVVARQRLSDEALYFGPFPEVSGMYAMLDLLKEIYPLKNCLKPRFPHRVCLNYHIKRCLGPCQGKIGREDYLALVGEVGAILQGKGPRLTERVEKMMGEASENLEFERAARLRDVLRGIEQFAQKQKVIGDPSLEEDIIGLACHESHRSLCAIQLFQVRGGILQGSSTFELEEKGERDGELSELSEKPEKILEAFLSQYYSREVEVPPLVLLPLSLEEPQILTDFLSLKRGGKVRLSSSRKGPQGDFLRMAEENAQAHLERIKLSRAQEEGALAALAVFFDLEQPPHRIECFDISTIQGSDTVASLVVFLDGKPAKSEYRRFRIRREGQDDFASMEEAVRRRFEKLKKEGQEIPDLVILDGGKGQLKAGLQALREVGLSVPIAGLAKRFEEIFLPGAEEPRRPEGAALYLLQRIRDEAHRFAVGYHRMLRGKRMVRSILDGIEGIGPTRRKKLLASFGSVESMREAKVGDFLRAGLPNEVAVRLFRYLQGED